MSKALPSETKQKSPVFPKAPKNPKSLHSLAIRDKVISLKTLEFLEKQRDSA